MTEPGDGYTFDVLWLRAGDGAMFRRRYELIEDPDGSPLGILVSEEPYEPPPGQVYARW